MSYSPTQPGSSPPLLAVALFDDFDVMVGADGVA